jgi:hypothetical protein
MTWLVHAPRNDLFEQSSWVGSAQVVLRLTTVATDISEYPKIWKLLPRGRR